MNLKRIISTQSILWIVALVTLVAAASTGALLTIPSVAVGAQAVTGSSCGGALVQIGTVSPGIGTLRYQCSATAGAFQVTQAGADTPIFTLPSGYTAVGFALHSLASCQTFTNMISGTSQQLTLGDYDICTAYNLPNGGTLTSFTVQWSN